MVRLYLMLLFALLILVVPVESEGQDGELADIATTIQKHLKE